MNNYYDLLTSSGFLTHAGLLILFLCLGYALAKDGYLGVKMSSLVNPPLIPRANFRQTDLINKIKSNYNLDIKPEEESSQRPVEINQLYLYPVRGIPGTEVDSVELTPLGLRYDRNWVIINTKTLTCIHGNNSEAITYLRQEFVNNSTKLRLYLQDDNCFPELKVRQMFLDFAFEYSEDRFVQCKPDSSLKPDPGYTGYKENEDVNKWLSQILGKEAFIIRAPTDLHLQVNKPYLLKKDELDRHGQFLLVCHIHLVNKRSCDDLYKLIASKYQDDPDTLSQISISHRNFRPNFIIDEDEPYFEEELQELRIGHALIRQLSPTKRCKMITNNPSTNIRDPNNEPMTTLTQERFCKNVDGPIFGVYFQADLVENEEQFKELLPGYKVPSNLGDTITINKGDTIQVRTRKRTYTVKD